MGSSLRIDLFMKRTGIFKRRTVARKMCEKGFVFLNGKIARASSPVYIDSIIEIRTEEKQSKYKVLNIPERVVAGREKFSWIEVID